MNNSKSYRLLLLLGILTILFEISLYFLTEIEIADSPIWILIIIERIAWMIQFFKNTKIRHSIFGRIMLISFGIVSIGVLFKLEHLSGASALFAAGVLIFCLSATNRFIANKEKTILSLSKLILILNLSIMYLLKLEHFPVHILQLLTPIFFSCTIIFYLLMLKKRNSLTASPNNT